MTDEELYKRLRWCGLEEAADRIEALVKELEEYAASLDLLTSAVNHHKARAGTAEAALKVAVYVIEHLHGAVCGETGFASAVRTVSGIAYPWPSLDAADEDARAFLAKHQVSAEQNGSQK